MTSSLETIRGAAHRSDGVIPNRRTTTSYRDAQERLFIIDDLHSWQPGFSPFAPVLAAVVLGVTAEKLLSRQPLRPPRDGTLLGALFESLVALSVRVYAQLGGATVAHLREMHGRHEVDLIVELPNSSVVAIETKVSDRVDDAVVVYTGTVAYRRKDGIAVVPLALLVP